MFDNSRWILLLAREPLKHSNVDLSNAKDTLIIIIVIIIIKTIVIIIKIIVIIIKIIVTIIIMIIIIIELLLIQIIKVVYHNGKNLEYHSSKICFRVLLPPTPLMGLS